VADVCDCQLPADSVEKLDDVHLWAVCGGTSTIAEVTIVDPEPI
jgi:hypothetical protein